ncbi:MAG TPA: hypothetical protein VK510_23515 [Solirubrobacteraceae bacterium]|nr:hypothetical protein [Solirubrobacteraceae bacterium]
MGATRAAIAALLLPGWLGLTIAGPLLHLLVVLVRVRDLRHPLPAPHLGRDRALAMLALLGVLILAASRRGDLPALAGPASVALVGQYLALGELVAARAARAVRASPARI